MNFKNLLVTLGVILFFGSATFAQGLIRGVIQDNNTDETLIGATIVIRGTTIGVTTNLDGSFLLIAPEGDHVLVISYVGYEDYTTELSVKDGSTYNIGTILMMSSSIGLQEINVFANVAIDRKTPVAVSTINAAEIVEQLGSQELPEVMNRTPSVYAVRQGGGFGDSRISIRGFDQRNIAVMVNGIPVNDMENGWVYWSNWAGLGDALRSIQIQRGLGASKLAINSVGGTMNMITKTTDANAGGSFQASVTDYGNTKMVLSLSTGKTKNGWAISVVGSRTFGPGYIEKTWVDAWSYFVSISKEWKKHLLTFTAIGAPQKHGQRSYTISESNFEKYGPKYNQHWGTYGGNVVMERENNYHKPQLALNWYWTIDEKSFLATSAYASFGNGYGTGTLDNRYDMPRYRIGRTDDGQIDWDGTANENATHMDTAYFDNGNIGYGGDIYDSEGEVVEEDAQLSKNILRESVNEHIWYGIISTYNHKFNNNSSLMVGIDGRTYVGTHYRRVRNLLGGDYWFEGYGAAVDGVGGRNQLKNVGDRIAYDNDGIVRYGGVFAQYEITLNNLSIFAAGTLSNTWYGKIDRYNYVTSEEAQKSDIVNSMGYNIKAGLNYNINERNNVFFNTGYYSRAPYWDFVFTNYNANSLVPVNEIHNEKIIGFEVGYGLRLQWLAMNVNLYYTSWNDKSYTDRFQNEAGDEFNAPVIGLNAVHMGAELDAKFKATRWLEFLAVAGLGDWSWQNDVTAVIYDDNTGNALDTVNVYASGVPVGGQPQTQVVLGVKFHVLKRITLGAAWRYYDRLYRDYDVTELDQPGYEVTQIPGYDLVDLNFTYQFKIAGLDSHFGVAVYNVLDNVTKNQGDQYGYFWTFGRNMNFTMRINF